MRLLVLLLLVTLVVSHQVAFRRQSKGSRIIKGRRKTDNSKIRVVRRTAPPDGVTPPIPGETYDGTQTKASDPDKVRIQGADAPVDVLKTLTQFDENSETVYDEDRCGAAVAIAAAVNAQMLGDLIDFAKTHVYDQQTVADYDRIKAAWEDKSMTWKDMGILMDHIYEGFSIPNPSHNMARDGMPGAYLYDLLTHGAHLSAPSDDAIGKDFKEVFSAGTSWPYLIHFPGATYAHWVLIGKGALKSFIYDPYPMSTHLPLFEEGTGDFTVYADWIKNTAATGSGWCVRSEEAREADLARAKSEAGV